MPENLELYVVTDTDGYAFHTEKDTHVVTGDELKPFVEFLHEAGLDLGDINIYRLLPADVELDQ